MTWRIDYDWAESWLNAQPADSVDLVFGSPPYLNQRTYSGMNPERSGQHWVDWMAGIYRKCLRICKGAVCFVVDSPTKNYSWTALPHLLAADLVRGGITLRRDLFYRRDGIPGSGGPDWFANKVEYIICATRGGKLPWSDNTACGRPPVTSPRRGNMTNRKVSGDREDKAFIDPKLANPGNAATVGFADPELIELAETWVDCGNAGGHLGDAIAHESEAPFPESLAAFAVKSLCPPGGTVCDPFTGSGTTAKVAVMNGRNFVGCEMRLAQVELACKRVRKWESNNGN